MDPDSVMPDLLRVEYADSLESSATRKTIYTTLPKSLVLKDDMPRIQKYLAGKSIWTQCR